MPCAAGTGGDEAGSSDDGEGGVVGWGWDGVGVRPGVSGGLEHGLALGGELLEDVLGGGVDAAEAPGGAELCGGVVGGHAVQDVVADLAFVDEDSGGAGCHVGGHHDIEDDLGVGAAGGAGDAVEQDGGDGDGGELGGGEVLGDVSRVEAIEFEQADGLSGAGESDVGRIGGAEVSADEVSSGTGAGEVGHGRYGERGGAQVEGLGWREVVESGYIERGNAKGEFGLGVGREEGTARGVRVGLDVGLEGGFHVGDRAGDAEDEPVGVGVDDGEMIAFGELDDCLIVLFGGAELGRELLWRQVLPVAGAERVGEVGEEGV